MDFQLIAKKTPGFVGADLSSLTKEAAVVAINRIFTRLRATSASPSTPTAAGTADASEDDCGSRGCGAPGNVKVANGVGDSVIDSAADAAGQNNKAAIELTKGVAKVAGTPLLGSHAPVVSSSTAQDSTSTPITPGGSAADGRNGVSTAGATANGSNDARIVLPSSPIKQSSPMNEAGSSDAVGGFLAGPLSPAQLAPLSVTMEDFLAAVKKVNTARAESLECIRNPQRCTDIIDESFCWMNRKWQICQVMPRWTAWSPRVLILSV